MTNSDRPDVAFPCPRCGATLKARASAVGSELPCPKCWSQVEVPRPEPSEIKSDGEDIYAIRDDRDAAAAQPPELPIIDEHSGRRAERTSEHSERPRLPRRPMTTGVLVFFLQPTTLILGGVLTIWAAAILGFGSAAFNLGGIRNAATWTGSMLLTGVTVTLGVIWLAAASECLLCILQDSAVGNTRIENWPDSIWLDWITDSFFVVVSVAISVGIGVAIAWLFSIAEGRVWLLLGCLFLFFPIVLLSVLETQSPLVPISPIVLGSLLRSCKTWATFYFETALLMALPAAIFWLTILSRDGQAAGGDESPIHMLAIPATAAAIVVAAMLYFRLLGRLAWVCAEQLRAATKEEEDFDDEETD